jgi:hypothetical protein
MVCDALGVSVAMFCIHGMGRKGGLGEGIRVSKGGQQLIRNGCW